MAGDSPTLTTVRFGPFELFPETGELRKDGVRLRLSGQPIQVLMRLVATPGKLVTREELQQQLWPSNNFGDFEKGLNATITRLRTYLNDSASDPTYIETIAGRGYRFIAEARNANDGRVPDEPDAKINQSKPIPTIHLLWVSAAVILAVAGILFWRSRVSRHVPSAVPELKTTQLIANSVENPVTSSAISPDGKYLAFTDNMRRRIRVRLLETGETQTIPEPESLKGNSVDWAIAAWFPDGTRFIANARPPGSFASIAGRFRFAANSRPTGSTETRVSEAASIWVVSVLGKPPQKLRDDADAFSVSPDGSLIAFGTNATELGDREIWLMDAKGQQARKLYDAPEKTAIGDLRWSGDGQRAIYLEVTAENGELVSRDLRGGPAIPLVQYSYSGWNLTDFVSLPDGRVMYVRGSNFWELRMDPRNGGPAGEPRQLTEWSGLWLGQTSVTSDGKRLVFQRSTPQTTVNVADIEANGTHLSPARHLTVNEYSNAAETWTPDSRAVVFRSRRNGNGRLFRQALNSDIEEPLVMGAERVGGSAISPDGAWLFYFQFLQCEAQPASCETVFPLMRIPIHGGEPHQVLVLTTEPYSRPRCTFAPANLCAIVEQSADGKPLIFTAFDALKGRGAEIARFETEPTADYSWGLSPDGTRIAIVKDGDNRIHIVSLKSEAPQEVAVKHWTNLDGVIFWAADGKGWFISSRSEMSDVLLHVDLQGEAHPLWSSNGRGSKVQALPSPDGRHLAIVATACNNNVWMMENF
jgi:DNA-binding winged helix-turn-helix (wHTH) protein/Tol biopolymer transport system component